jgi:hypothetical protein
LWLALASDTSESRNGDLTTEIHAAWVHLHFFTVQKNQRNIGLIGIKAGRRFSGEFPQDGVRKRPFRDDQFRDPMRRGAHSDPVGSVSAKTINQSALETN